MASGLATGSSGGGDCEKKDLEEMMQRLGLSEVDLDDMVFQKESPPLAKATWWLALIKLHIGKDYGEF